MSAPGRLFEVDDTVTLEPEGVALGVGVVVKATTDDRHRQVLVVRTEYGFEGINGSDVRLMSAGQSQVAA